MKGFLKIFKILRNKNDANAIPHNAFAFTPLREFDSLPLVEVGKHVVNPGRSDARCCDRALLAARKSSPHRRGDRLSEISKHPH